MRGALLHLPVRLPGVTLIKTRRQVYLAEECVDRASSSHTSSCESKAQGLLNLAAECAELYLICIYVFVTCILNAGRFNVALSFIQPLLASS